MNYRAGERLLAETTHLMDGWYMRRIPKMTPGFQRKRADAETDFTLPYLCSIFLCSDFFFMLWYEILNGFSGRSQSMEARLLCTWASKCCKGKSVGRDTLYMY